MMVALERGGPAGTDPAAVMRVLKGVVITDSAVSEGKQPKAVLKISRKELKCNPDIAAFYLSALVATMRKQHGE